MNREYTFARKILLLGKNIVASRNDNLKSLNLTIQQADALLFFNKTPDASIRQLSNYLEVTHQTASGIVKRLCDKDAIIMTPSEKDARYNMISLTTEGLRLVELLKENGTHTGEKILSNMSADEKMQFEQLLDKALANIAQQQQ